MPVPTPFPGLVISYSYLWEDEARTGQEEGRKDRRCAIVLARQVADEVTVVTVLAITHTPPHPATAAIEISSAIKKHLCLDDDPSWVILSEVNEFVWPGPDLRPIPGSTPPDYTYGVLPPGFFRKVRDGLLAVARSGDLQRVQRSQ